MLNWMFGLPGRILCEHSPWCQSKWWACSWLCSSHVSPFSVWSEPSMQFKHHVRLIRSSLNACLIIAGVSAALFPRFARHLMQNRCRIHCEIASDQIHDFK
jgi:hypothetical protein